MIIQWQPLIGGIIIGCSAIILFFGIRRVAGISGIVKNVLFARSENNSGTQGKATEPSERWWSLVFLIALMLGTIIYSLFFDIEPALRQGYSKPLLITSGLLVGFGTAIGNGCTSGHGVCGIGRLSKRSIVATIIFMAFGVLSVTALRVLS